MVVPLPGLKVIVFIVVVDLFRFLFPHSFFGSLLNLFYFFVLSTFLCVCFVFFPCAGVFVLLFI